MAFWLNDPKRKIEASSRRKLLWLFRVGYDSVIYLKTLGFTFDFDDLDSGNDDVLEFSFSKLSKYLQEHKFSLTSRRLLATVYKLIKTSQEAGAAIEDVQEVNWFTEHLEITNSAGSPPTWVNKVISRLWGRRLNEARKRCKMMMHIDGYSLTKLILWQRDTELVTAVF